MNKSDNSNLEEIREMVSAIASEMAEQKRVISEVKNEVSAKLTRENLIDLCRTAFNEWHNQSLAKYREMEAERKRRGEKSEAEEWTDFISELNKKIVRNEEIAKKMVQEAEDLHSLCEIFKEPETNSKISWISRIVAGIKSCFKSDK